MTPTAALLVALAGCGPSDPAPTDADPPVDSDPPPRDTVVDDTDGPDGPPLGAWALATTASADVRGALDVVGSVGADGRIAVLARVAPEVDALEVEGPDGPVAVLVPGQGSERAVSFWLDAEGRPGAAIVVTEQPSTLVFTTACSEGAVAVVAYTTGGIGVAVGERGTFDIVTTGPLHLSQAVCAPDGLWMTLASNEPVGVGEAALTPVAPQTWTTWWLDLTSAVDGAAVGGVVAPSAEKSMHEEPGGRQVLHGYEGRAHRFDRFRPGEPAELLLEVEADHVKYYAGSGDGGMWTAGEDGGDGFVLHRTPDGSVRRAAVPTATFGAVELLPDGGCAVFGVGTDLTSLGLGDGLNRPFVATFSPAFEVLHAVALDPGMDWGTSSGFTLPTGHAGAVLSRDNTWRAVTADPAGTFTATTDAVRDHGTPDGFREPMPQPDGSLLLRAAPGWPTLHPDLDLPVTQGVALTRLTLVP